MVETDHGMEPVNHSNGQLVETSKRLARRLLTIGENRFELLMVEAQQERQRLLHAILLGVGVISFGLLAGVALTGTIVVLLWEQSKVAALLVLTTLYGATAFWFCRRLTLFIRDWKNLPATFDQFRKDRIWLEQFLT